MDFHFYFLYFLYRHRAINLFLNSYKEQWLGTEEYEKKVLIEDLTVSFTGNIPLPNTGIGNMNNDVAR